MLSMLQGFLSPGIVVVSLRLRISLKRHLIDHICLISIIQVILIGQEGQLLLFIDKGSRLNL